jgi:hypothetical protein
MIDNFDETVAAKNKLVSDADQAYKELDALVIGYRLFHDMKHYQSAAEELNKYGPNNVLSEITRRSANDTEFYDHIVYVMTKIYRMDTHNLKLMYDYYLNHVYMVLNADTKDKYNNAKREYNNACKEIKEVIDNHNW